MKHPAAQLLVSLAAAASLLGAVASQATNLADKPLKASVLAKPNVIFGMDDSGSMDWEILLDTSSGMFWWNGVSGWNTVTNKPVATSGFRQYTYLFPVGTATGGQIYAHDNAYGRAVPPTNQFAWLRSPAFNPIYYDTSVTYKPWSDAYHTGAVQLYPASPAAAAWSHPNYRAATDPAHNLAAQWDAGNANFNTDGYRFYVQAGMVLPIGTRVESSADNATGSPCTTGTTRILTAEQTVAAGERCQASIPYYPATFWHAETCTIDANCVASPDGSGTLKRYEIKIGNAMPIDPVTLVARRTDAEELQNFANWFTYYRKRKLMLAGSMGLVLENTSGLRLGVARFNSTAAVTMRDADSTNNATNRLEIAGRFYTNSMSALGTPTHATIKHIGEQFDTNSNVVQFACQRNSAFIVTDGFSNTTSITPPAWTEGKTAATYGAGSPYQTTVDGTQADLALRMYTNRLRIGTLTAGKVPPSTSTAPNADKNPDLHITTYGITLGVRGTLWPSATDPFVTAPLWTTPVADDPSLIDDLWHATINGRGQMYLASTPDETAKSIKAGLDDILSATGAQGGIAVSTVNLSRGFDKAFFGTYDPSGWTGDLTGNSIDKDTGVVTATPNWTASSQLTARDWTTRVIASWNGSVGVGFTAGDVASVVNAAPGGPYGSDGEVMNYLRGDRTHEGTKFRPRKGLLGAIINSEPAVSREHGVAYVQSGEGMLHAFDVQSPNEGAEMWAFVPRTVLSKIGGTAKRGYVFGTLLDGSPLVAKLNASTTLLIAGTGVAGRSFHALDVSAPRGLSEAQLASKVKWEFPADGDGATQAKMGQAMGRPIVVKTKNDGMVALLTSGYNNSDKRGRLWMLPLLADGSINTGSIHEFDTGASATDAGLAHVSAFLEANGTVRYVYGGDLNGNLWRFDLELKGAPFKLATLKNESDQVQPVTSAPELLSYEGKRIVLVGTGRVLDITDFANNDVQTFYAISDGAYLDNPRNSAKMVKQTYTRGTDTISTNPVEWKDPNPDRGWYLDLPAGEKVNTRPAIAYGAIAFVSNVNGATDCSASSYLYVLDVTSGSKYADAAFTSTVISTTANSSAVTALRTVGGKIVGSGQDTDGKPWQHDISGGKAIAPAKNSWREIRR